MKPNNIKEFLKEKFKWDEKYVIILKRNISEEERLIYILLKEVLKKYFEYNEIRDELIIRNKYGEIEFILDVYFKNYSVIFDYKETHKVILNVEYLKNIENLTDNDIIELVDKINEKLEVFKLI